MQRTVNIANGGYSKLRRLCRCFYLLGLRHGGQILRTAFAVLLPPSP